MTLSNYLAAFLIALLLPIGIAFGQTPGTGAVAGLVHDPAGRLVQNAEILVVNEATHSSRMVTTTSEGFYRVQVLQPGYYSVTVTSAGFAPHISQGIEVTVSETTSLNVSLTISTASTTVKVVNDAEVAELESSTLGGLVNETAIQGLPLSNRNFTQILGLSPGVVVDLPNATLMGTGSQNVASDGATPTANNFQFNGVDANNLVENSFAIANTSEIGVAIPSPDVIEEFRVQTANFDAAYGRGTGANVDMVSKSGSNRFHGSVWEFARNNIFNANDFFLKQAGQPKSELKHNQFGGTVGGPIVRDKTFFFVGYEGLTEVNGLSPGSKVTAVYPLLTSDRSAAALGALFCPAGHLNSEGQPASGYLTLAGGAQVACDGSNINPVALAVLNAKLANGQLAVPNPQIALPNTGPDASDQLPMGQSTFSIPGRFREDQFSINGDQILSQKNTLAGRFFYSRATQSQAFEPNAADVPGWSGQQLARNTMFVLADTQVFNSNLLNAARFGYMRFDGSSSIVNPLTAEAIGIDTPTGEVGPDSSAPGIWAGGLMIGDAGTPSQWQVTNSFIYQDTVSWTHGRHNARFGLEFKRHEVDENQPVETDGLLQIATFSDFLVGQSAAQNGSPSGLSNVTSATAGGGIFRRNERYTDFGGFAQDDIKLTRRLTINAGLRYEIFGAALETNGRLANFNANIASTGPVSETGTFSGFTMPSNFTGTVPEGVEKTSFPGLYKTPLEDVSPRFGFVWQVMDKPVVVVRGGVGIYYDEHSGNLAEQTLTQPPFASLQILSGSQSAPATLQNPFVPHVLPNSSYPVFTPRTPTSIPFIEGTNPNTLDGKTTEYNLNVQYALGRSYVLQVGYVGTNSNHRSGQIEFDQAFLASPENPVNGETTNSIANAALRMPIQGVSEGSLFTDSVFVANYNALQVSVTRHMQHGFQFQGSYTWSKNLDEVNGETGTDVFELQLPTDNQRDLRTSYGLAGDDRDQRVVFNFTWQTPKVNHGPKPIRYLLDDWVFSGIGVFQTGIPLSIIDGNAGSVYALLGGEVRAERTGSNPSTHGSLFSRVQNTYLDASAFTRAPEAPNGTSLADQDFGNSGVGIVRGPGQHNVDLAIERLFPIKGGSAFLFRAEAFNLTNTPQFGNPSNSLGYTDATQVNPVASSTFGKITSTVTNPRIIQFAAKFQF